MDNKTTQIDVLIITAVKDELDVVRELESDWKEQKDTSGFPYFTRKDKKTSRTTSLQLLLHDKVIKGGNLPQTLPPVWLRN